MLPVSNLLALTSLLFATTVFSSPVPIPEPQSQSNPNPSVTRLYIEGDRQPVLFFSAIGGANRATLDKTTTITLLDSLAQAINASASDPITAPFSQAFKKTSGVLTAQIVPTPGPIIMPLYVARDAIGRLLNTISITGQAFPLTFRIVDEEKNPQVEYASGNLTVSQ